MPDSEAEERLSVFSLGLSRVGRAGTAKPSAPFWGKELGWESEALLALEGEDWEGGREDAWGGGW